MKSRILYPAGLGLCLAVLALSAGGQTAGGNASQAAVAADKTTTAGATVSAGTTPAHHARAHHASTHHAMVHHAGYAQHEYMMTGSAGGGRETAYRAALKHCVAGPAAQREGCLDNAIVRFGRT